MGINEALRGTENRHRHACEDRDGKDFTFSLPSGEKGYRPPADVLTAAVPHLPLFTDSSHDDDKKRSAEGTSQHCISALRTGLPQNHCHGQFRPTLQILKNYKSTGVITAPSLTVDEKALSYKHDDTQKDTEPAGCLIELLPRIHQGARLIFELDQIGEPSAPATAPIRAWLMATRFGRRRAMLCYTPTGQPLFEIHCIDDGPARCRPLPSSPTRASPTPSSPKATLNSPSSSAPYSLPRATPSPCRNSSTHSTTASPLSLHPPPRAPTAASPPSSRDAPAHW